jgi:hypothetical protein
MSRITEQRPAHFRPDHREFTQQLCVGPKFLASAFVSDPSNDEQRRKWRFSRKLFQLITESVVPYTRVLLNRHVLDEAATRLKKKSRPEDAFDCVGTVRSSEIFDVRVLDEETFTDACNRFRAFDDHDGAMTDFLTKSFVEHVEASYLATWDDHYQAFDDLRLLPHCDYE